MIRPTFKKKGGDVELADVQNDQVVIKLSGAGDGAPISFETSSGVIERIVRSRVPQIRELTVI